ncbi:MAG: phospholipid carrier-dependent glycosyltransferase [Candidatus Omnitrophica bacterium]|nr:phospholipid carrier-dependent glycosyltransferase [Candidatus Omnitrophota bacterium]
MKARRFGGWYLAVVVYATLYGVRLGHPPMKYFDEVYQVTTAQQFLALSGYRERAHPPLGMELMAGSIALFGDHPWAWRLVSCLAGLGSLMLIYGITRRLSNSTRMAWLAVMFFGLDGLAITQARIGVVHASMLFWMLLSVWCLLRARCQIPQVSDTVTYWLMGSGLAFGAASATRWVGASIAAVLLVLWVAWWRKSTDRGRLVRESVVAFIGLPLLVYFGSYLIVPYLEGHDWSSIWTMQRDMLRYHLTLAATHRYDAAWWTWPLLLRPIWYGFEAHPVAGGAGRVIDGVLCIGNPLVTWMVPVGMGYLFWKLGTRKLGTQTNPPTKGKLFVSPLLPMVVLIGFFTQWLQWVGVKRVTFFHYFYTAMPFVAIALAAMVERGLARGGMSRRLAMAYLVAVVAMAAYWYPLWTGLPIPEWYYQHHIWFRSWV